MELVLSRNNVLFRSFNVICVIQDICDSLGAISAWTRCWSQTKIVIHKAIIIWFCHYLSIPRLNTLLFDLYLRAWLTQSNLIKIAAWEFFKIIIFYLTVFNRHFCIVIIFQRSYARHFCGFIFGLIIITFITYHSIADVLFFCYLIADLRLLFKKFYKSRTLQIRWHIYRTWSLKISHEKQQRRSKICWVSAEDYERWQ